jgi:hypothetical protein
MVLLIHETTTDSSTAISEGNVAGEYTPSRLYLQEGKYLAVEGTPAVVSNDVEQLCLLGFRLATPAEMNAYTKQQKQTSTIVESTPGDVSYQSPDDVQVKE